jgi:GGDEF domain-containing protein
MTEAAPPPIEPIPTPLEADQAIVAPRAPEDFARLWMENLVSEDGVLNMQDFATLQNQLVTVYGLENNGHATDRDRRKIAHRMGLLSLLLADDPDPVNKTRADEFAYDFVHLVWKEAITDNAKHDAEQHRQRLHELATHDPLTGLKNRRGLAEDLDEMIPHVKAGHWEGLALLYLDLDRFKEINDTPGLGHRVGDEILAGVARILENQTRKPGRGGPADVIARPHAAGDPEPERPAAGSDKSAPTEERPEAESVRMGGDEFVLLLPQAATRGRAPHPSRNTAEVPEDLHTRTLRIASRLAASIAEFMNRHTNGQVEGLGVSIGYSLWQEGMTADDLIREGDHHMYEVKRGRKDELANGRETNSEPSS